MAGENTVATLNGMFKTVYADRLLDLCPDFAILQKRVEFSGEKKLGAYYAQPVNLAQECGFSYVGSTDAVGSLADPVAGAMKEAQVYSSELILRAQLSYKALSHSLNGSASAFKKATAWKVEDMNNAMRKRLEIAMLYGQTGVGIVSVCNATDKVVVTDATWAGGIWAGAENSLVDIVPATLTGAHVLAAAPITAVDSDAKQLTVTGATGATVVAGNLIFFKGACITGSGDTFAEMAGLQTIITNSTTLFGINASTYSLWKGTTVSSAGQPSFSKFQSYIARAINKGLMEKVVLLCSPKCFAALNSDSAALRVFDSSYGGGKKGDNGFESLAFHSTNGIVEVISHPLVKDGDAFIVPLDALMRLGSTDLTFGLNGMDDFLQWVPGKNAYEIQAYADTAIFCERPAHCVYVSGLTYA